MISTIKCFSFTTETSHFFLGGCTALRVKSEVDLNTLYVPPQIKVLLQTLQLLYLGYMETRLFTVSLEIMETE